MQVYDGATLLGSATTNGSGAWSYTTAALANGSHSFTATATDTAGNTSVTSSALAITMDTVAPAAPSITAFSPDTGVVGDGITDANVLTLTGTAEANSTVNVYDGATLLGSATANGSGAWSFTTGALSNATHSFTATRYGVGHYECGLVGPGGNGGHGGTGGDGEPAERHRVIIDRQDHLERRADRVG